MIHLPIHACNMAGKIADAPILATRLASENKDIAALRICRIEMSTADGPVVKGFARPGFFRWLFRPGSGWLVRRRGFVSFFPVSTHLPESNLGDNTMDTGLLRRVASICMGRFPVMFTLGKRISVRSFKGGFATYDFYGQR